MKSTNYVTSPLKCGCDKLCLNSASYYLSLINSHPPTLLYFEHPSKTTYCLSISNAKAQPTKYST